MQENSEIKEQKEGIKDSKGSKNLLKLLYGVFFVCVVVFLLAFFNVLGARDQIQSAQNKNTATNLNIFYVESESLEKGVISFIASKIIGDGEAQIPDMSAYNDSLLILDEVIENIARDNGAIILREDAFFSFANTKNITDFVLEKFKEEFNKRSKGKQ